MITTRTDIHLHKVCWHATIVDERSVLLSYSRIESSFRLSYGIKEEQEPPDHHDHCIAVESSCIVQVGNDE
jgi:hypothetical protein